MNLGNLRKSLSKLPKDMDDLDVVLMSVDKEENIVYGILAFTGIIEKPVFCLALGDEDTVYKLREAGNFKFKQELE